MEVKEWHRSSVYHCECKQKSKSGGSLRNEAIICELLVIFQVGFWSFQILMVVFECVTGKRPFLHGDPAVAIGW